MDMNFFVPVKIVTGKGCVRTHADVFLSLGNCCLIVTGKSSAAKCGALSDVTDTLSAVGIRYEIYNGIGQNPTFSSCKEASVIAKNAGAGFIVGIGGGSPLDAAKAVAVLAASHHDMTEDEMYSCKWEDKPLPVIAVGTTAGTGSEVTPVSVITNTKGLKKSFRSPDVYPVCSFGDAGYTMTLGTEFTRSTAIDALAHCLESYFNRTANEISRTFALRGTKILCEMLPQTKDVSSLTFDDREKLYCASIYGGLAISVTGTAFPHALGYFLSENHGVPHGIACGVYLPAFLEHVKNSEKELYDGFFSELGISDETLCGILKEILPDVSVSLTKGSASELYPRYADNKSLRKTPGTFDGDMAIKLITELFCK